MKRKTFFIFLFFLAHALFAEDTVSIAFVGPDSMHIAYHADTHSDPVWLIEEAGGFTQIQQVNGSGAYYYAFPTYGYYRFGLGMYSNGATWVTLATASSFDFQGDRMLGYMHFDEVIDQASPTLMTGAVIVPTGISLALQRCGLVNDSWIMKDFIVSGVIEVTENVTYTWPADVEYHMYSPQTLQGCVGGQFYFRGGSGGSSLTGGSNVTLFAYDTLAVSDVNSTMFTAGDAADVVIEDSVLSYCTITGAASEVSIKKTKINSTLRVEPPPGETTTVTLEDSNVMGLSHISTNAIVTAEDCIFDAYSLSVSLIGNAQFTSSGGAVANLQVNAPDGTCTMNGTTNGNINIIKLHKGTFDQCLITGGTTIGGAADADLTFNSCRFYGNTSVSIVAAEFTECDFGEYVNVVTPCAADFSRCQFLRHLGIGITSASADLPTIEDNSFLYKYAIQISGDYSLTNVTVPIGANYFGDPAGPVLNDSDTNEELFKYRGGSISWWPGVQIAEPLKKGIDREVHDLPVSVWIIAQRGGQGTIPHTRVTRYEMAYIKGRESVYIVDVGVNRSKLENVEIRAVCDGIPISPTRGSTVTLYRDYSQMSTLKKEAARNTINFILPPTDQNSQNVSVEYRLSPTEGFKLVCLDTLYFNDELPRTLQLNIVPIRMHVFGYSSGTPDAGRFKQSFVRTMSAKTFVPAKDIHIWHPRRPFNYYGALGSLSLTYLLNDIALQLTAGRALISCCNYLSDKDLTIDYTIALLDDGVLKAHGVDGASLPLFRRVLFTDGDTDALLHEFGHAFGLYTSLEQYDKFPKFGKRVAGVSAFVTEPVRLPGFMGDQRRLRHLPGSNLCWYTEKNFFDIMGGTPKNSQG